jgi:hypothetical protein
LDENAVSFARSFFEAGKPVDLPAFCDKMAEEICEGKHEDQTAGARR